jgi:regulator of protease activity HflC (stomatin/prohibitin superfamily)
MIAVGIVIGLGLCLLALSWRSNFRVQEGYLAVVTTFGAAQHDDKKALRLYPPGMHFKWPWQEARSVSMKEQNLELAGETGGQQAMAQDGTMLRFDSMLRMVPDRPTLEHFLFGMTRPVEHITGLFACLLRNEIANFEVLAAKEEGDAPEPSSALARRAFETETGSYALIQRERTLLNKRIETFCHEQIGDRYGVKFNAVDLLEILPPDELAEALNAVISARSTVEMQYFRAEAEAQKQLLAARAGVEIATIRAGALETEIQKLGEFLEKLEREGTLADYVTRRKGEVLSQSKTLYLQEGT